MILALHQLDIEAAYPELDRENARRTRPGLNKVEGERAYQVQLCQPSGDLPCRVTPEAGRASGVSIPSVV